MVVVEPRITTNICDRDVFSGIVDSVEIEPWTDKEGSSRRAVFRDTRRYEPCVTPETANKTAYHEHKGQGHRPLDGGFFSLRPLSLRIFRFGASHTCQMQLCLKL